MRFEGPAVAPTTFPSGKSQPSPAGGLGATT